MLKSVLISAYSRKVSAPKYNASKLEYDVLHLRFNPVEYSIKEITGISRLSDEDPTKIIYLKIKVFVPLDKEIETQIKEFENGQTYFIIKDNNTSEKTTTGKHILKLDDISLISSNQPNTSAQSINLPWLNQESTSSRNTPYIKIEDPHHVQKEVVLNFHSYPHQEDSRSITSIRITRKPLPTITQNETSGET
ncbi:unnamed protein product [Rhizophagus irregularis]|nr:unnamed protein product [Rhizophagus irregularis]